MCVTDGLKRKLSSDSEYEEEIVVKKVKIEGNIKMEQESEDSSDVGSDFFTTKSRTKKTGILIVGYCILIIIMWTI